MEINLVSDTVTKPSYEMVYVQRQVGDDVYKQDPTVIELELLGHVLAWKQLLFSVGTMANQTALKLHTYGKSFIAD
jgi:threonine aldolase